MIGVNPTQLKEYIIEPTLKELDLSLNKLNLYSKSAVNLLLGTCAQESLMGYYLHQIKGPALGIYQMEPATHDDIWNNYLKYNQALETKLRCIAYYFNYNPPTSAKPAPSLLVYSLRYATAMCRVHYLRVSEALPEADDVLALANYWKKYYNTEKGKGTVTDFIHNYNKFKINDL